MSVSWPAGLRDSLLRDGYTRTPEAIVEWREVEAGPPRRKLVWPTPHQKVTGTLPVPEGAAEDFEDWMRWSLDRGRESFGFVLRDWPAPRSVIAHFTTPAVLEARTARLRRYSVDLTIEAPSPVPAAMAALAALDGAGPTQWPASLPQYPLREGYTSTPANAVLRPPQEGPASARLKTRNAGRTEKAAFRMTPAQLQIFELWFQTSAAFGARDIGWPVPGGFHLGCFASGYSVAASAQTARFTVSFERYFEAVT